MVGLPTQGGDGAFFDSGITALTAAPAALTPVVTTVAATVTTVSATAITAQPLHSSTATAVMVFAITPKALVIDDSSFFALNYRAAVKSLLRSERQVLDVWWGFEWWELRDSNSRPTD